MISYLKKYVNNRIAYAKLEVVDSVSNMIGAGIFGILVGVFGVMILFIGSMAAAFILSSWFDDMGTGFLLVMGVYILMLIIFILFRRKLILIFTNNVIEAAMEALDNSELDEDED